MIGYSVVYTNDILLTLLRYNDLLYDEQIKNSIIVSLSIYILKKG